MPADGVLLAWFDAHCDVPSLVLWVSGWFMGGERWEGFLLGWKRCCDGVVVVVALVVVVVDVDWMEERIVWDHEGY